MNSLTLELMSAIELNVFGFFNLKFLFAVTVSHFLMDEVVKYCMLCQRVKQHHFILNTSFNPNTFLEKFLTSLERHMIFQLL